MDEFEQLVQKSYRALLDISTSLDDWKIFSLMFDRLPETIADKETLQQIEINELFKAMRHTRTYAGAATLYRSLIQPLSSLDLILAKQESLRELESNDRLRDAVVEYLEEIKKDGENALYDFINEKINDSNPYPDFKAAMKTGAKLADAAKQIPKPESRYLDTLVSSLQDFSNTESYRLMRGPIYRTFRGLKSKEDIGFLTPRWKFSPTHLSVPAIALIIGVTGFVFNPIGIEGTARLSGILGLVSGSGVLYMGFIKPGIDCRTVIEPLARKVITDPEFKLAIDSLGKLDELVSFYDYAKAMPGNMTLPKIKDADNHYFRARNVRNPILGKDNPDYVPNDVELDGCKLTLVTGPNSGGKTTLCKTVAQIALMAQIGSYVPADDGAEMSATDGIFYQYYQPDRLQSSQGDFGVNLARTRDIFYAVTPKSLVVLNSLASGTTSHEELEQSYGILRDFAIIGNNTIYVTHRYELAERFQEEGLGQFLRTHFKDEKPTFKFVPGISRESHAAITARNIEFSPKDRQSHLIQKGYLAK